MMRDRRMSSLRPHRVGGSHDARQMRSTAGSPSRPHALCSQYGHCALQRDLGGSEEARQMRLSLPPTLQLICLFLLLYSLY
jgi:hypothetical protein